MRRRRDIGGGRRQRRARGSARPLLVALLALAAPALAGCASAGGRAPAGRSALPPFPEVRGAPDLYVAYPDSADPIAVSDSNFIFGTTGTGAAELTIGGRPVDVHPNGSFLAWLPVPGRSRGDTAVYRLVARVEGRADTLLHPVVLPARPYRGTGAAWIDTASVADPPVRWGLPGEAVEFEVRAAPGARVRARIAPADSTAPPGIDVALEETARGRYRLRVPAGSLARAARAGANGADSAAAADPRRGGAGPVDTLRLRLTAAAGGDTTRAGVRFPLRVLDPGALPVATLREAPDSVHGRSGVVAGRPLPDGAYAWLFPDGSRALVDGRRGDRVRLRLTPDLAAWIPREDAEIRAGGARERLRARVGVVRAEHGPGARIRIPLDRRLPAAVHAEGPRELAVTFFGGLSGTGRMVYPRGPGLLEALEWRQLPGPRYRLRARLARPAWGWRLRWEGATAVLEIRRPPEVDRERPLRGQRVAVDPGHPPVGAEGPTGLTEADANLAVARQLAELLESVGAEPVLVRRDTAPVGLYERRRRAREAGATTLVSIHNNALPDGLRPFGRGGTSTYYFHPHARPLARAVQRGMLARMGLRDRGVRWGNLALPREPWIPTVLTEGAFMMIPRHEAALRTEVFQRAYARGVLDGLREFYRSRGR